MREQADAAASLKGIARIEAGARGRGGWYGAYLWTFAGWQLALVPVVLLWHGPAGTLVGTLANALVVMGLSVFATRQPVVPRGFGGTHLRVIGAWALAYVLTLAVGYTAFRDSVTFAAVAALACALPGAVAAWRETRAA
jgi:TM2 domain-containing membrane protein YozV